MNDFNRTMYIPKKAIREIDYMLYHYGKIDRMIENKKNSIIEDFNPSNIAWLKAKNNDNINTLENVVIRIETDKRITRLRTWKKIINDLLKQLMTEEYIEYFYFIKSIYFDQLEEKEIQEEVNISKNNLIKVKRYLRWLIYQRAKEQNLYMEEAA